MQRESVAERAHGKWASILANLGVPAKALTGKHCSCPFSGCGGRDRFRFDDKGGSGSFICSKCGAGKGVEFVKRFLGVEFKEAAQEIEKHLGGAVAAPTKSGQRSDDRKILDDMKALWKRTAPIEAGSAAGIYLHRRVGLTEFPSELRFSSDERYYDGDGTRPSWHPAMVARILPSDAARAAGEHSAIHRTYLTKDGRKAEVASPRKMMGSMPTGAAVRLMPHDDVLGIAEGIETALSASALFQVPVWAALTADLLQAWEPPPNVRTVMIFGDTDDSFTGQAAAFALARRLKAKQLNVTVELPVRTGTDWNDLWQQRKAAA